MKALKIVGVILALLILGVFLVNKYDPFGFDPARSHSFKFNREEYGSPEDTFTLSESGSRAEVFGIDKSGPNLLENAASLEYKCAHVDPSGRLSWIAHVRIRNLNQEYYDIREDDIFNKGTYASINLLAEKRAWVRDTEEGGFEQITDDIESGFQSIKEKYDQYLLQIAYWDGKGEVVFLSSSGWRFHIYDIVINPELPDSFFRPE